MATIKETGDEWVVSPEPILVPVERPKAVPASTPVDVAQQPTVAGKVGR